MRAATTLLLLAATATAAAAQAPRITEAGDPSVRSDTIYKLAVDPSEHPDESFVYLLDDGVVRFEADGTGETTYRYVAQVLTQEAVETWGENSFGYDASRQRLRINWARVIDAKTGQVISDKPVHDQESLAPVAHSAPVYTDQKIRRISLGGVAPGTIVDYSYTVETLEPVMPGAFATSWSVHTGLPTRRSRYLVDLPVGMEAQIKERNLNFARQTREAGGRRVYTWATAELPKIEGEPFAADSNGVYMSISLAGPMRWADISRWYAGLAQGRYEVTPEIEAALAAELKKAGAATRQDSLRALHRWIAQDFRYVSLSLGIGGYQPRTPRETFETQYGDCKDKATLFIALARRMGHEAFPVLLSSGGGVDRTMPAPTQFDHMIAAVANPDGGWTFLDLTAELTPFGVIPPGYQGEFGLLVRDDGTPEELTFPRDPASANRKVTRIAGEIDADGLFNGSLSEETGGWMQYQLRSSFANKLTQKQREDMTRALAHAIFEGATGDSLQIFDGRDLTAQPRLSLTLRGGRATDPSGSTHILTLPLPNFSSTATVRDLEARKARGPRLFPIDVESVVGEMEVISELKLTLPEGWTARLPDDVEATSTFGTYRAEYTQEGRELRVVRTLSGGRGVQPPEAVDGLIAWLKDMSRDDVRFLVIETSGS